MGAWTPERDVCGCRGSVWAVSARANLSSADTRVHVAGAVVVNARAIWDNRPVVERPGADKAGEDWDEGNWKGVTLKARLALGVWTAGAGKSSGGLSRVALQERLVSKCRQRRSTGIRHRGLLL
jgi:hypothetical protein